MNTFIKKIVLNHMYGADTVYTCMVHKSCLAITHSLTSPELAFVCSLTLRVVLPSLTSGEDASIPGLDFSTSLASAAASRYIQRRKVPYAKPIPKDFESAWSGGKQPLAITRSRVPNGESSNQQQAPTDDHQGNVTETGQNKLVMDKIVERSFNLICKKCGSNVIYKTSESDWCVT